MCFRLAPHPHRHRALQCVAGDVQIQAAESALRSSAKAVVDVAALGPRKAIEKLCGVVRPSEKDAWVEGARVQAIVGSCPASLTSARSGMRAWVAFARKFLRKSGVLLPPALDELLAWSQLFRHERTFANYLTYVRLACEIVKVPVEVFDHPSLKRAKIAIAKKGLFATRKPRFIGLHMVRRMVARAAAHVSMVPSVMLYLMSYIFLLRVPSEAIPVCAHTAEGVAAPVLVVRDDEVVLRLPRRKNRRTPSVLRRGCWCRECTATCPVHALGSYFQSLGKGERPFLALGGGAALRMLRALLTDLQVPGASEFRTHDLRRGHAEDMRLNGATLGEILRAGDWKSPAFLQYLDQEQLEVDRIVEAHLVDSSDGE